VSWIIVRSGPYRYLKSNDVLDAYGVHQRDAVRFDTREEADRAKHKWVACWSSTAACRVVKLRPRGYWRARYALLAKVASDVIDYEWATASAVPPNQVAWCRLRDALT